MGLKNVVHRSRCREVGCVNRSRRLLYHGQAGSTPQRRVAG